MSDPTTTAGSDAARDDATNDVTGGAIPERMVPGLSHDPLYQEHVQRYVYAATFAAGKDVLDVACGVGYGTRTLADAGAASALGVDLSEAAVRYAADHYAAPNVRFAVGNAQALPPDATESYDLVVSFETIEHLPDVGAYLAEMHRALRPGGTFLCSTPDARLCSLLSRFRGGRPRNPHHLREYTLEQFLDVLQSRFEVREVLGQQFISSALAFWPVQVALKGSARAMRGTRIPAAVARLYNMDRDYAVRPRPVPAAVARYWVAHCVKPA